jgi:hypothetical protein
MMTPLLILSIAVGRLLHEYLFVVQPTSVTNTPSAQCTNIRGRKTVLNM